MSKVVFTSEEVALAEQVDRQTKESIRLASLILRELSFLASVVCDYQEEGFTKSILVKSVFLRRGDLFLCGETFEWEQRKSVEVLVKPDTAIRSDRYRLRGVRKRPSTKTLKKAT